MTERGHPLKALRVPQAACDVFCVGDDVNIEKANNSLISNDRSWKRNKFRLTYVAEAPELTQGTPHHLPGEARRIVKGVELGGEGKTGVLTSLTGTERRWVSLLMSALTTVL